MARISTVSLQEAPEEIAMALRYTRSAFAKMTGRETDRMIEPLQVYALSPTLFTGIQALAQASSESHSLNKRYHALGQLKAATLTTCEYCIDIGSAVSRQWGLTDEELLALPAYKTSPLFDDIDRLVLDYAVGMSRTPVDVPEELVVRLREHFSDEQILELTHHIALENMYGRFNHALGIGSAGLTEGMVCAVPEVVA